MSRRCQPCFAEQHASVFCDNMQYIATSEVFDGPGKSIADWSLNQIELYLNRLQYSNVPDLAYQMNEIDDTQLLWHIVRKIFGTRETIDGKVIIRRAEPQHMPQLRSALLKAACFNHFARLLEAILEQYSISAKRLGEALQWAIQGKDNLAVIKMLQRAGAQRRDSLYNALRFRHVKIATYLLETLQPQPTNREIFDGIQIALRLHLPLSLVTMLFMRFGQKPPHEHYTLFDLALLNGWTDDEFETLLTFPQFDMSDADLLRVINQGRVRLLKMLMTHAKRPPMTIHMLETAFLVPHPEIIDVVLPAYSSEEIKAAINGVISSQFSLTLQRIASHPTIFMHMWEIPDFLTRLSETYRYAYIKCPDYKRDAPPGYSPSTPLCSQVIADAMRLFRMLLSPNSLWNENDVRQARDLFSDKYLFEERTTNAIVRLFDEYIRRFQRGRDEGEAEPPVKMLKNVIY